MLQTCEKKVTKTEKTKVANYWKKVTNYWKKWHISEKSSKLVIKSEKARN